MDNLRLEFQAPPVKYRIKPFWFWNGDITTGGIERQIKEMHEKGLGGFFICARQGLTVPYLSKKWFDLIKYACKTAEKYGLESWLYDEYPYPSGMAGGEVLKQHPEARHTILQHYRLEAEGGREFQKGLGWETVLFAAAYRVREDGSRDFSRPFALKEFIGNLQTAEIYQTTGLTTYNHKRFFSYGPREVLNVTLPEGKWSIEIYTEKPIKDFKFYGSFFDPCDPDAVKSFLAITHEQYKREFGETFPNAVKGIYSDEVGMLSPVPWSKRVPEAFQKIKGYSILENLPALNDASWPSAYRIRYDLYDVAHQIFVASYHKQVSDWCAENGIAYCTEVPYMRLSTQRYSTIPGGDTGHEKAGRSLEWIYDNYLHAFRYSANAVASLARQLGRKQCMIECFHSVGWTMTLQDARWMIDRLCGSGINFFVFHAFFYTIDSITQHDSPPSHFYQTPCWKHYRTLADYVGRLCALVSNTKAINSVAVLDPVPTLWALLGNPFQGFSYCGESDREQKLCDRIRDDWVDTTKTILLNQLQYDHLDSEMLPDFQVQNGRLILGDASYRLVIVPPSLFFEKKAFRVLEKFAQTGGHLLFLGNLPFRSLDPDETDQEMEKRWKGLLAHDPEHVTLLAADGSLSDAGIEEKLVAAIKKIADEPVEMLLPSEQARKSFITAIRKGPDGSFYLFLINQGMEKTVCTVRNRRSTAYTMTELFPETGRETKLGSWTKRAFLKIPPLASRYFCLRPSGADAESDLSETETKSVIFSTEQPFQVTIEGGNVFRISDFEISRDGKKWWKTEAKPFIEQCTEAPILLPEDYGFQSEFGTPKRISISYPLELAYRSHVMIREPAPKTELLLDKRTITGESRIFINGRLLQKDAFYHRFINDPNNLLADITAYLKTGSNEVKVLVKAEKDSDGIRSPLYLTGTFGVSPSHEITAMPREAYFNSNVVDGFPYYSGTMTFQREISMKKSPLPEKFNVVFDFGNRCLDCLEVRLNGKSLGIRPFTPYQWSCRKEWVRDGKNQLELIRTNTLANMLDGTYFDYKKRTLVHV